MIVEILWGGDDLPARAATDHFMVVGASGSGKTILIERLLFSLFANPNSVLDPHFRAVIYDPKQEMVPLLYGMNLKDRVRILHPFDTRSWAWDMAKDIDGPLSARQAATLLVPERENSGDNSFFDDAVRDLLTGVMLAFINCVPKAGDWTFRDILLSMLYPSYLHFILGLDTMRDGVTPFPSASRLVNSYLKGDDRTVANIRASINTRLSVYEPIAAVWEMARLDDKALSLKKWMSSNQILVLGNDETARVALDAVNQVLFKRLTELLLNAQWDEGNKHTGKDLTWIFLDEVREAGKLDGLARLLNKGRGKGVAIVLGFQDIEGLRAVYGDKVAGEITGQCQNIAALQLSNPATAEWATELFGKFLMEKESSNRSHDQEGGVNIGTTKDHDDRTLVYTGNLIYLPETGPKNGLSGYFRSRHRNREEDGFEVKLEWIKHIADYRPGRTTDKSFEERPTTQHYLQPWTVEDWERLGFDPRKKPLPDWKTTQQTGAQTTPKDFIDNVSRQNSGTSSQSDERRSARSLSQMTLSDFE